MIYNVLDYNASGDGITNCTAQLNELAAKLKGKGGVIYFPSGKYLTGSVTLYSNTTVYLEAGAEICANGNKEEYPVVGEDMVPGYVRGTRKGILFACGEENISIKGDGLINGNGENWWKKGESDEKRPRTIQFINCSHIKIDGIRIINSPCWTIHPVHCNDVSVSRVSICNPYSSPNTDGINPESCCNVRISDCNIDVGDDCITLKSGLEHDLFQKQFPCENITITGCTFVHGHGGVVLGSEMSGGIKNITVSNCVFQNTDRGIRIKTRRKRGGVVENLIVNNVIMERVVAGITMNGFYACGAGALENADTLFPKKPLPIDDGTPIMRNFCISNVIMYEVQAAGIYLLGLPEMPLSGVKISNVEITVSAEANDEYAALTYGFEKSCGEGIYMNYVDGINIQGCSLSTRSEKYIIMNAKNAFINDENVSTDL